jgi:hypothetical protein
MSRVSEYRTFSELHEAGTDIHAVLQRAERVQAKLRAIVAARVAPWDGEREPELHGRVPEPPTFWGVTISVDPLPAGVTTLLYEGEIEVSVEDAKIAEKHGSVILPAFRTAAHGVVYQVVEPCMATLKAENGAIIGLGVPSQTEFFRSDIQLEFWRILVPKSLVQSGDAAEQRPSRADRALLRTIGLMTEYLFDVAKGKVRDITYDGEPNPGTLGKVLAAHARAKGIVGFAKDGQKLSDDMREALKELRRPRSAKKPNTKP